MSELPNGWVMAPIKALGELKLGKMLDKAKNQGLSASYLRNINVRWRRFDLDNLFTLYVSPEEMKALSVEDGDLFICEGGEPGRSAVWRGGKNDLVYQKALHRFRSNGAMVPELLMYRLMHDAQIGTLADAFTGTTIKHLTGESLSRYVVPVPPLSEQKRIAVKLDDLLARIDACRARLDRIPAIMKRFRQAVVAAATCGDLTKEWRLVRQMKAPPFQWESTKLIDLCARSRVITYGVIKLGNETVDGVPCLRTSNVRWLRVDTEGIKRISPALSDEYSRTILKGGEVLVNVRGTLGGVAIATPEMRGWNVSREVAVVPTDESKIDPRFLSLWIGAEHSQRWLSKVEKGVAYTGINIEDLRTLPVSVPPLEEQIEIVQRVVALLAIAEQVDLRYQSALRSLDALTPSILDKAFRGELVPQDPNDEPASALLERILAGQAESVAPKAKRGRKPRVLTEA